MSELRRLLDDDCDDLARAMLNAARDEEPPRGSLPALAAVLGVAPAALTSAAWLGSGSAASSAVSGSAGGAGVGSSLAAGAAAALGTGAAATTLTGVLVAKYVAVGMVSGLVAMGGFTLASQGRAPAPQTANHSPVEAPRAVPVSSALAPADGTNLPTPESDAVVSSHELVEPRPKHALPRAGAPRAASEAEPAPLAVSAADVSGASAPTSAAAFVDETPKAAAATQTIEQNKGLSKELALLDRARGTLLAGQASEALGLLDQYRRVRVSMILDPEAEALRILALDRLGQHATASRLAREFIASHPASRQVDSLRALAEKR